VTNPEREAIASMKKIVAVVGGLVALFVSAGAGVGWH
jgi:hypothetical protein